MAPTSNSIGIFPAGTTRRIEFVALPTTVSRILRRPLLWAIIFSALTAAGLYAAFHIPVEVLPRFRLPRIGVVAHYPGAAAEELEYLIARPLEERLFGLPEIAGVRSTMGAGVVTIDIRFRQGTDSREDLQEVNGAIDRARGDLPASVHPAADIMGTAVNEIDDYVAAIPPGVDPATVKRAFVTSVMPALRAVAGVRRVEVYGCGDEALWVQPDLDALRRFRIPVLNLVQALGRQAVIGPAGYLTMGHQDVLIGMRSLPTRTDDLAMIPVDGPSGPIPLGDLARIVRTSLPVHSAVSFDGLPGIALAVFKQPGASTLPVSRAVLGVLDETLPQLPAGVRWVHTYRQGRLISLIGDDLGRNLLIGAFLAVATLLWILGAGRGIWLLALSIPFSLLMGVAGLYILGRSLDLMTLGALSVAVGLLADDAVIVLESIYHRWESGDDRWEGIRRGLADIAAPDITGTLTTVAVFAPLLFVGDIAGLFVIPFALAMTIALLASLFASLTLIPLGLGFVGARSRPTATAADRRLRQVRALNERLFAWVARRPRTSLAACGALLVIGMVALVLVPVDFLPLPNEGTMLMSFALPPGSSLDETREAVAGITGRLRADVAVEHTFARVGSPSEGTYTEPASAGEIQIVLKPGVAVNSLDRIGARLLRESRAPGVQLSMTTPTVERVGESLSGLPQPFAIRIFGDRIETMRTISEDATRLLAASSSVTDVFNNDAYPVTQVRILPKTPALAAYGLSPDQLYGQLRPLMEGEVAADLPEGNYRLPLYLRLADASHTSLEALRSLPIRTSGWTPLGQVADLTLISTPNQIHHFDGARALEILAIPKGVPGGVIRSVRRTLAPLHLPPGYRIGFGGLYPELEKMVVGLAIAVIAAFVLSACILILQFDGLLIPGLLLLQIPLAFTGGAFALVLSGAGLNASGMVAFLTLVGIGLNHGIVLLHRVRRNEAAGMSSEEAVAESIRVRFRPILLTTVTAALGMLPTALGFGQGAAPEQGLAVVILGGIIWSALMSTNLIPALYLHGRGRTKR